MIKKKIVTGYSTCVDGFIYHIRMDNPNSSLTSLFSSLGQVATHSCQLLLKFYVACDPAPPDISMLLPGPTKGILVCTPPWMTKMETRVYMDWRWQNHWVDSIGRVSSMTTYGILPFHLRPPSLGQFVSEGGGNIYITEILLYRRK